METFAPGPVALRAAAAASSPGRRARAWPLRAFRPPLPAQVVLRDGVPAFVSAGGDPRRGGRPRRALARVRRLVGRGLEPRGMGRLARPRAASTGSSTTACATSWFVEGELD